MLQDKMGRQFHYLRLSITDVCNFKCTYCLPDGFQCDSSRDFLSLDEIRRLVTAFARLGTSKIRITGGEPALRKDLPQIIQTCKSIKGIEQVALTSNGFNLEQKINDWVNAGLDSLNISIDSLKPDMFRLITGHDKLESILRGLNLARQAGLNNIKINTVLMQQYNANQLDEYLSWLQDKAYTLRFIELMQTGDNSSFFKQNHVSGESIKQKLLAEGWSAVIRDKAAGPAQEFYHPDYQGKVGLIMPYSKDFCVSCNRLRMSALGQLHLCLFTEHGIDMRSLLKADSQLDELCEALQLALADKTPSHLLQEGETGGTSHLAMIGG